MILDTGPVVGAGGIDAAVLREDTKEMRQSAVVVGCNPVVEIEMMLGRRRERSLKDEESKARR